MPLVTVEVEKSGTKWAFQIEATEVPRAAYRAFLKAKPSLANQDPWCAFNTSFEGATNLWLNTPKCETELASNTTVPDAAISCVDWCDAAAFCAWSGRRLCGGPGGALAGQAQESEWGIACAGPNFFAHAYGPNYVAGNCDFDESRAVGSSPLCEGGVPGLMDMQGGLREWSGNCGLYEGPNNGCETQGSLAQSPQVECPHAGITSYNKRSHGDDATTFRCCADL